MASRDPLRGSRHQTEPLPARSIAKIRAKGFSKNRRSKIRVILGMKPHSKTPRTSRRVIALERVMRFTSRIKHRDTEGTEEHRERHGEFLPSVFLRALRTSVFKTGKVPGRVGVPPAGSGVPPEPSDFLTRMHDATCVARQAGCLPYPGTTLTDPHRNPFRGIQ